MNDIENVKLEGRYAASEGAITRLVQKAMEDAEGRIETVTHLEFYADEMLQSFGRPKKVLYWSVTIEGTPVDLKKIEEAQT